MMNTTTGWGRAGFWGGIALFVLGLIMYGTGSSGGGVTDAASIGLCRFAVGACAVCAILWALGRVEDQLKIIAAKDRSLL